MTSRAKHFQLAEQLLEQAKVVEPFQPTVKEWLFAEALVHATLANCPQEVINEVLDAAGEAALQAREAEWAKDWPPGGQTTDMGPGGL